MSHIALVNVDAAASSKLSSFLADLAGDGKSEFLAECEAQQAPVELLQTFLSKAELMLALDEKGAEGCFQALVAIMLSSVADAAQERRVVQTLVDSVSACGRPLLALRVFVSVFNILRSPSSKFLVLKSMLSYAIKHNSTALVCHFESRVCSWVTSWELTITEQRELYLLMADTLFDLDQESRALFFLTQYLTTISAGEDYSPEVVSVAIKAIVSAIRSPVSLYKERNTLSSTLAGRSSTDPDLLKLLELLRIFCVGSVDDYNEFFAANQPLLVKFDICPNTSLKSMRLLGLCGLAARSSTTAGTTQLLAYSDIAKTLEVSSDEEVEEWVVEAISQGLLEATMDQLNRVIVVSRCVRVSFGRDEWVSVQQKLSVWRNNLANMLEVMRSHHNKQ